MTARDEAIQAVADAAHEWRYGETAAAIADNELCILSEAIVDAIPSNVLALLAIEQGGLIGLTQSEWCDPDTDVAGDDVLYRLVDP